MKNAKKRLGDVAPEALLSVEIDTTAGNDYLDTVAQTLPSNTGLKSHIPYTVGLDWLDFTFRNVPTLKECREILEEAGTLVGDVIEFWHLRATFSGREWTGSGRGGLGTLVFYDDGLNHSGEAHKPPALKIVWSGSIIGPANQLAIALWLFSRAEKNDLDCTRLDVALDDHNKFVSLGKITKAQRRGNYFNVSHRTYIESGRRGEPIGKTLYFGAVTSDKRLRIYDKSVESGYRICGNRWEAEFKRKAAKVALYQWIEANLESETATAEWCTNVVTGLIDFRHRGSDDNRARCPVLGWFRAFCNDLRATPARVRVAAPVQSVQKAIDWVVKSVAPSLALISKSITTDFQEFLQQSIKEGGERLSAQKRKLLLTVDKQQLCYTTE